MGGEGDTPQRQRNGTIRIWHVVTSVAVSKENASGDKLDSFVERRGLKNEQTWLPCNGAVLLVTVRSRKINWSESRGQSCSAQGLRHVWTLHFWAKNLVLSAVAMQGRANASRKRVLLGTGGRHYRYEKLS